MKYAKQAWYSLIGEPFTWIFYSFFRPVHFKNIMAQHNRVHRGTHLLRLAIAVLLCIEIPPLLLTGLSLAATGSKFLTLPATAPTTLPRIVLINALIAALPFAGLGLCAGLVVGLLSSLFPRTMPVGKIDIINAILGSVVGAIAGGVVADCTVIGLILGSPDIFALSFVLLFGTLADIVIVTTTSSLRRGLLFNLPLSILFAVVFEYGFYNITHNLGNVGWVVRGFIIGFVVSMAVFYRVHFYLVSMLSTLRALLASRKCPPRVFTYLRGSALYWDERVYFPLPGLKQTLLIAAERDIFETLQVLYFIAEERPLQLLVARAVYPEIILRYLETCRSREDIANASEKLDELFSQQARQHLLAKAWVQSFRHLYDASREACRWPTLTSRQLQMDALQTILNTLGTVHQEQVSGKAQGAKRLEHLLATWTAIAEKEQKRLDSIPITAGDIPNPYRPDAALPLHDALFVGRRALAQQLETFLKKREQGALLLLHAERKVGKTSFLKQLPRLLGRQYIPVLQEPGMLSSAEDLLQATVTEIRTALADHDIRVEPLTDAFSQQRKKSDALAYDLFSRWFADVEVLLAQKGYTLLLIFDAFDELEEMHASGHLDLELLLSKLHRTLQRCPRLTLLLSGVNTLEIMERRAGQAGRTLLACPQTMKMPCLSPEEARFLILSPTPEFPGENVFPEAVIDAIFSQTGDHPFLVQALCFTLINVLNAEKRDPAVVGDVTTAVEQVLDWWDGYFRDLWNRTSEQQRACLRALTTVEPADIHHIQELSGLDEQATRQTLQTLVKRSLVCSNEDHSYQMAAPTFRRWVERCLSS